VNIPIDRSQEESPVGTISALMRFKDLIEKLGTEEDVGQYDRGSERLNYLVFLGELKAGVQRTIDRVITTLDAWDKLSYNAEMWADNQGKLDEARNFNMDLDWTKRE
jgi:hypothetical protein